MQLKGLKIDEALGRKEGMAVNYGNLGIIYQTRGELDRAEEMYLKALALFRDVGMEPEIKKTEHYLEALSAAKSEAQ